MKLPQLAPLSLLMLIPFLVGLQNCRSDCYDAEYLCMDNQVFYLFEKPHAINVNVAHRGGTKTWPRASAEEQIWREKRALTSCDCAGWPFPRQGLLFGEVIETVTIERYRCTGTVGVGGL